MRFAQNVCDSEWCSLVGLGGKGSVSLCSEFVVVCVACPHKYSVPCNSLATL